MTLGEPIIEYVIADVVSVLQGVTRSKGYHQDLEVSRPAPAQGKAFIDGCAIVYLGDRVQEHDAPQQYEQWLQIVSVYFHVIEAEGSTTPIDTRLNRIVGDACRALTENASIRQRNGFAIDTWPKQITFEPTAMGANEGGATLDLIVQYRHTFGNPFDTPHKPNG